VKRPSTVLKVRGLYAITPDTEKTESLVAQVSAAISGGVRIVQYRNKTATPEMRLAHALALKSLCGDTGVSLIINDHVELALAVDADGVHVGSGDTSYDAARGALGDDKLIGISCYNQLGLALAAASRGADYIAFGSFFPSRVKPGAVHAPTDLLNEAKRRLEVSIVAIGGITIDNAPPLISAGADALAVISALFSAPDVTAAARSFTALFEGQR
jgi:thiamine-phosphate pyrophosphorylase